MPVMVAWLPLARSVQACLHGAGRYAGCKRARNGGTSGCIACICKNKLISTGATIRARRSSESELAIGEHRTAAKSFVSHI